MTPELEKQLVEKHPKIFVEVGSILSVSNMAWGLCVGDGWYWLVDQLCKQLQQGVDLGGEPQIVAAQVKEKFAGLRFYVNSATDKQYTIIDFAEALSFTICESCGSTKDVSQLSSGWIKTQCAECRKE